MTEALTTLDFFDKLHAKAPKNVLRLSTSMHFGEQVKYVTIHVDPKEFKTLELIHITDVQFGHVCCDVKRLNEYLDWILEVPNRFILLGGDLVDAAHPLSIAHPMENHWKPNEQCWRFAETFMRVRHRVIGYVGGNHERRTDRTFGNLGTFIAMMLKVPYSEGQQFIDIHYGDWKPFKISLWHGGGSAKTKGAKAMVIERFMQQGDSNLYLVGHLHDVLVLPAWNIIRRKNRIEKVKKYGAMSSSFLEFFGTYAEVAGLTPSDTMMVRTILEPSGHCEVTVR